MSPPSPPTNPSLRLGFAAGIRAAFASVWGSMLLVMLGASLGMFPLEEAHEVPIWMWPIGMSWAAVLALMSCMADPFPGWILLGMGTFSLWSLVMSEDYRLEAKMGLFYSGLLGGWLHIGMFVELCQPLMVLIVAVGFHVTLRWPLLRYHLQPRVLILPAEMEGIQISVSCPCCDRELDSVTLRKHPSRFFCPGCGRRLKVRSE